MRDPRVTALAQILEEWIVAHRELMLHDAPRSLLLVPLDLERHALVGGGPERAKPIARLDSLRAGRVLQPGGPVFGVVLTQPEFERAVRQDTRSLT